MEADMVPVEMSKPLLLPDNFIPLDMNISDRDYGKAFGSHVFKQVKMLRFFPKQHVRNARVYLYGYVVSLYFA